MLQSLDIDLAGDFLVMAATLMQIKSAMLLPQEEAGQLQADDLADPRAELIRQLLEYKKFKDAANLLEAVADEHKERFARPDTIIEQLKPDAEPEIDIEQVSIWDLLEAFDSICKATGTLPDISHIKDDTPIDLYQIEVLHRLQTEGPMMLEHIFGTATTRIVMVGLFLAILELVREGLVWAESAFAEATADRQAKRLSSIYLRPLTEEPAEQAVRKAIIALAEAENQNPVRDALRQTVQAELSVEGEPKADEQKQPAVAETLSPVRDALRRDLELPPIPIVEVSSKAAASSTQQELESIEPVKDHK
jgi:segregation and condensation protein A